MKLITSSVTTGSPSRRLNLSHRDLIVESLKEDKMSQPHVRMWQVSDSIASLQHLQIAEGQSPCCSILVPVPAKLQNDLLAQRCRCFGRALKALNLALNST